MAYMLHKSSDDLGTECGPALGRRSSSSDTLLSSFQPTPFALGATGSRDNSASPCGSRSSALTKGFSTSSCPPQHVRRAPTSMPVNSTLHSPCRRDVALLVQADQLQWAQELLKLSTGAQAQLAYPLPLQPRPGLYSPFTAVAHSQAVPNPAERLSPEHRPAVCNSARQSNKAAGPTQAQRKRGRQEGCVGFQPYVPAEHRQAEPEAQAEAEKQAEADTQLDSAADVGLEGPLEMLLEAQKMTAKACSIFQQHARQESEVSEREVKQRLQFMAAGIIRQFNVMLAEGETIAFNFRPQSCELCATKNTPMWRRLGTRLVCNACGLRNRRLTSPPRASDASAKAASDDEPSGTERTESVSRKRKDATAHASPGPHKRPRADAESVAPV